MISRLSRWARDAERVTTGHRPSRDRRLREVDETRGKPAERAALGDHGAWMVVMTAPNAEASAIVELERAGWTAWRPVGRVVITQAARRVRRTVWRSVFPRYVFVRGEGHAPVMACRSVTRLLPERAPAALVAELSARQAEGAFDARPPEAFAAGAAGHVRIADSADPIAAIVQLGEGARIVVLMRLLGRWHEVSVARERFQLDDVPALVA
jgi:hypothetical protein